MASCNSPHSARSRDTRLRLERAWKEDINWDLYPTALSTVSMPVVSPVQVNYNTHLDRVAPRLPNLLVYHQVLFLVAY